MVTSFRTKAFQTKANFTIPKAKEPLNYRSRHFGALWLCQDCLLVLLRPERRGAMEMLAVLLVGSTLMTGARIQKDLVLHGRDGKTKSYLERQTPKVSACFCQHLT